MIDIKMHDLCGLEAALHGMRNPLNSWERADSAISLGTFYDGSRYPGDYGFKLGAADAKLARALADGGPVHAKYRRMITVYADINAPLYWWKEFDTYRAGVEKNSCSTMHTITQREFTLDDFSHEHLDVWVDVRAQDGTMKPYSIGVWSGMLESIIEALNDARYRYISETDVTMKKQYWWQIIQLLPTSYNQRRTVMMSYEALAHMYTDRRTHKLDEWRTFCRWVSGLPYFREIITPEGEDHAVRV